MQLASHLPVEPDGRHAIRLARVRLSSPDKVLYPAPGITKRALAEYLTAVHEQLLPHAARRPLTLLRCPQGRGQQCFFQRHHSKSLPSGLRPVALREKQGRAECVYIEGLDGLLATAQAGVLELHLWGSRVDRLETPDRLVFDLDPDEGVDFGRVRKAAVELRQRLAEQGLQSFPLLTGGKGIHLVLPLLPRHGWAEVKDFARDLARGLAEEFPEDFVATASKAKRAGKIYIDWLRNERGATAICPYATRAKPHCPIATPVSWRELPRLRAGNHYTLRNILRRLSRLKQDPWAGYFDVQQTLPAAHS